MTTDTLNQPAPNSVTSTTEVLEPTPPSPSTEGRPRSLKPLEDPSRCHYRYPNGRRCCLPGLPAKSGLCLRHYNRQVAAGLPLSPLPNDSEDLSTELVCGIDKFRSAEDINHVLGELYKLLAANKISPRRGAVMAYTCSLLLRTLPVIDRELQADNDSEPKIIFDLPRPKRDWPEDPERALYKRMSSQSVPDNGKMPNSTNTKESS